MFNSASAFTGCLLVLKVVLLVCSMPGSKPAPPGRQTTPASVPVVESAETPAEIALP